MKEDNFQRHLSSQEYNKPILLANTFVKGDVWENQLTVNKIAFVLEGCLKVSFGRVFNLPIGEGKIILLPIGCRYKVKFAEDSRVVVFQVDHDTHVANKHLFESVLNEAKLLHRKFTMLNMNEKMWTFMNTIISYMEDGLCDDYFLRLKVNEMLYLLWSYYPKDELAAFLRPLLTDDVKFVDIVYDNWSGTKTLEELATLTNLSVSGFTKKFKRLYGISPYRWIMKRKSDRILYELNCSNKSFKDLSEEYNFNSVSHFNYYCKTRFGLSPGQIRQSTYNP